MKKLIILIQFSLICFFCLGQRIDTLFLKRNFYQFGDSSFKYTVYHAIYIDSNYSEKLKSIIDQYFDQIDSSSYKESLKQFHHNSFKKFPIKKQFPKRWIELFQYHNEFYTYHPSDFGNLYKFQLTDSTTIEYNIEPGISFIRKANIDPNQINLRLENFWKANKLNIHFIDTTQGLAIFTFGPTKLNPKTEKKLMVCTDKMHLFKTIINYCEKEKTDEFEFEIIDFSQLENKLANLNLKK